MDRYPDDLFAEIQRLTARVEQLEAQQGQRAPLTTASQGWRMSNMTIPSVSAGTCHIGCNGGDVFSVNSAGDVKRMFKQGAAAPFTTFDLGNAPASYDQTYAQQQSVGISRLFSGHTSLRASLIGAEHIAP
ncbi:hypothetical protein [Nonomuraea sp. NPDC001023]|uniref:hypothetical protein n=1 Tax=unclassified Nonomuraea TaxID=2593643 RepID=UPI00332FD4AA